METFDDLKVRRTKLAQSYLTLLEAQPGRPLALFAPRRVGKTYFLLHDLYPVARKAKLVPVYADLWLQQDDPLAAITHALEEALEAVMVPKTALGKAAKTPVKKIGAFGAAIELGEVPGAGPLPAKTELRFDTLVARLYAAAGRPVLLMLDEVQQLGALANGQSAIAALRAVLQKRHREVYAVFTGSSQETLAAMMVASGGPMYQFAQLIDFPVLGDEYLELLAQHFAKIHTGKSLVISELRRVFAYIGYKPDLMKDIVKSMSAEGSTDVDAAVKRMIKSSHQQAGWHALLNGLSPFDRALLVLLARGGSPFGKETLALLGKIKKSEATIAQVRAALSRLKRARVLSQPANGVYLIEDRLFASFLIEEN